jgi:type IV pilus assembly protein PilC
MLPFIKSTGAEIPTHTQVLLAVSSAFVNYWYVIFGTPIILYAVLKALIKKNEAIHYFVDGLKLKIWLFGPLALKIKLARFANYFAMMYSSGITVLDALKITESIVDNRVLEHTIQSAREKIADGTQISTSFEGTNVFPSMIVRMIRVGEDTGAMDEALLNVSYFYNREVKESIDKIEPVMMPMLTVILGLMMMWIMTAVMDPVYDAVANVKF